LSPGVVNNLQIAFNADGCEVDQRTNKRTPITGITQKYQTQPIAARSTKVNIAKFHRVCNSQKQTADEIKRILIEYQQLFLVLFGGYQGVQDQPIGRRSYNSNDKDSTLEIENGTT